MQNSVKAIVTLAIGASLTLTAGVTFGKKESDLANLGSSLYNDINLSLNQNQACKSCHHPSAGFEDPDNRVAPTLFPVSDGSDPTLFGGRNAPSAAYAASSPIFYFDAGEGLFIGGMFWDGRATGWRLGDPLAEQALGPFLNPVEMALLSKADVIAIIQASDYATKFEKVFGPNAFADIDVAYDNVGKAIAAFEKSDNLISYKSKFDKFWVEQGGDVSTFGVNADGSYAGLPAGFGSNVYSGQEALGLALFNATNKGNCAACHSTANDGANPPVFTDYSYDNLGIPVNPRIAELAGLQKVDFGLGAMVNQLRTACEVATTADVCDAYFSAGCDQLTDPTQYAECVGGIVGVVGLPDGSGSLTTTQVYAADAGKFKVPTLRSVERSAPYAHNGYFATLEEIVNFYNTRDVELWSPPEVALNVNSVELGNLMLTPEEEAAIVAFLKTLTD